IDNWLAFDRQPGVHRAARGHAFGVENLEHAPHADAVAVFAPGEIRIVVYMAREIAAHDARAARIVFLVRLLDRIPIFEIARQYDGQPFPARPSERLAMRDWNEVVLHALP